MSIYAIADLHLGSLVDKPMDRFGQQWKNHKHKIETSWLANVKEDDLVLIPGDISWAMTLDEAMPDLMFIEELPGQKVILRGNHDYWWKSVTKLNKMFDTIYFLQNDSYIYNEFIICGTRGWTCPNDIYYTEKDSNIYRREIIRLTNSLEHAEKINKYKTKIVIMHYPPTNDRQDESDFIKLFKQYNVGIVLYGHLHGEDSFGVGLKGIHDDIEYRLVSADYLDFKLLSIVK